MDFRQIRQQLLLDPDLHHNSLASMAAQALRERRFQDAFALADRRCRIKPIADASHFLLRATALRYLGAHDLAYQDIHRATAIDPENSIANRLLLASSCSEERFQAAKTLIRNDKRHGVVAEAIVALDAPDIAVIGAFEATFRGIQGWLTWRGHAPLRLRLRWKGKTHIEHVCPDMMHPLAPSLGSGADWNMEWPNKTEYVEVLPLARPHLLFNSPLLRPAVPSSSRSIIRGKGHDISNETDYKVAVILPVHSDFEATRTCLATLLENTASTVNRRIIAIDDASPDRRIAKLLKTAAAKGSLALVRHEANLGFARSVNHALEISH